MSEAQREEFWAFLAEEFPEPHEQLTEARKRDWRTARRFMGQMLPHLMRLLVGSDHRILVPSAALFGGAFLVLSDTLARTVPMSGFIRPPAVSSG